MLFCERLRAVRLSLGMSQYEFADMLGVKRVYITHYESGERIPKIDFLRLVCEKCVISAEWMLGIDEKPVRILTVTNSEIKKALDHIQEAVEILSMR